MGLDARPARPGGGGDRARPRRGRGLPRPASPGRPRRRRACWPPPSRCRAPTSRVRRTDGPMRVDLAYGRHGASVEVPGDAEVVCRSTSRHSRRRGSRHHRGAAVAAGRAASVARPAAGARPGRRRLPGPHPADAEPHRPAAAARRAGACRGARRAHHAAVRHRDAPAGQRGGDGGAGRARRRRPLRPRRPRRRRSDAHVRVGEVDGAPSCSQREYVEADVRIITGFVEPHFFAGFSGGPKAVCPGLAATETILEAHHPRRIADAAGHVRHPCGQPGARLRPGRHGAGAAHLSLDVAINRARRVTAVFAGPLPEAHDAACAHVQASAVRAGRGALRPRRLDQRRPPARPQPLPGGQGHGGSRADRARRRRRHHGGRLRGRGARRTAPSPACWRGARRRPISGARRWRPSSTVAGPGAGAGAGAGRRSSCTATASTSPTIADALLDPSPDLDGAVAAALGAPRAGRARVAVLPEGPLHGRRRPPGAGLDARRSRQHLTTRCQG